MSVWYFGTNYWHFGGTVGSDYDSEAYISQKKEAAADLFASNKLIAPDASCEFVKNGDFRIETIRRFAAYQRLMPYIVIGRLQREKRLDRGQYNDYRPEYKPA